MTPVGPRPRDARLLDAIGALAARPHEGSVWRAVREGRDPTQGARAGGRWDDQTFDVLYTATAAAGAVAEMRFHLARGQPVFPSKVRYELYELRVALRSCVEFPDLESLAALGVDKGAFGQLAYHERNLEYPRTQDVAEAAFFLGRDGVLVPGARHPAPNLILFTESLEPDRVEAVRGLGVIDWSDPRWSK